LRDRQVGNGSRDSHLKNDGNDPGEAGPVIKKFAIGGFLLLLRRPAIRPHECDGF